MNKKGFGGTPTYVKIFVITIFIVFLICIIFSLYIIPKQLEFINKCESICLDKNMNYETSFRSNFKNLNGKCFCITKEEIKIVKEMKENE